MTSLSHYQGPGTAEATEVPLQRGPGAANQILTQIRQALKDLSCDQVAQGDVSAPTESGMQVKGVRLPLGCNIGAVLNGKKKRVCNANRNLRGDALWFMVQTWARHRSTEALLNNGWRLARLVVGGWWLLVIGGWWRLAVGGWWSLGDVLHQKTKCS